jgi:hypothetical protein
MTGSLRVSRGRTLVRLAGLALVLSSLPAAASVAEENAELVGYDAAANGMAFTVRPSIPALLPVEAPFEATVSLATATLSSGGQGFGRASTFFPGTPIVGIRPLIEIASGTRLPLPDYPIVVESREFEDAKHNEQPGFTMSSDVDPERAVAIADAGGMAIPGALSVHSSRTVSTSLLEGSEVSATSTSTLDGIDIGGVVTIESIVSTASVVTDAVSATCGGDVVLNGVSVNGQAATVDADGLHLQGESVLPAGPLADATQPDLGATGITVRLLGGVDTCEGPTGSRSTSGVLVSVPLPAAGSIPPGGHLDVILASTSASAGGSTLPSFEPAPFEPAPQLGNVVSRLPGPPTGGAALQPVVLPPSPTPPARSTSPASAITSAEPVSYSFAGVPAPMLVGLSLLALPAGRRIRRYMGHVLAVLDPA